MGRVSAPKRDSGGRLIVGLLVGLGSLLAQEPAQPVFTADVRLVTLPATVKDERGAPIGDLDAEDFSIFEEGEPRELAVFERSTDRPLSVVLMLDASLSTAIELRYERESASRFLARLLGTPTETADHAAVFSFSSDVEVLQSFTVDHGLLDKALGRVRPRTGTSVYDAVLLASQELRRREGRRVIVIITDGGDTTSYVRFADALRAAHDAEAAIYPLIVLPIRSDAGRNRGGEHALITLAKNTGGESWVQHGTSNLDAAFAEILRTLRTQYLLGYYPLQRGLRENDQFRNVEVVVGREGATVLVRSGYFAEALAKTRTHRETKGAPVRLRTLPQVREPSDSTGGEEPKWKHLPPRRPADAKRRPPIVRPGQ